ncbi:MAG: DUF7149 domain-containing protein, partial [Microcystaceae cyanobacterium]
MTDFFTPHQALNKAFLKLDLSWDEVTLFRENFLALLDNLQQPGREDFYKNFVRDFFKKVYYDPKYFINIKNNLDFVIHTGKDSSFKVGVIAEFKQPDNKAEMPKSDQLNVKGLQQLLFYFL